VIVVVAHRSLSHVRRMGEGVFALTTKLDTTPAVDRVKESPMTSDVGLKGSPDCPSDQTSD
jgi:hypothetical protein